MRLLPLCEYEITVRNRRTGLESVGKDCTDGKGKLSIELDPDYEVVSSKKTGKPHFRKVRKVANVVHVDLLTGTVHRYPRFEYED